jgi:hypothetical protein
MLCAGKRRSLMSGSLRVFGVIVGALTALLAGLIVWASLEKNVLEIFKVMWAERWGIVTLLDLYLGFLIVGAWIVVLEGRKSVPWIVGMLVLGNFATAAYVLWRMRRARTVREVFMGGPSA